MLYLKPANFEDIQAEYEYVKTMPIDENGLTNEFFNISREDFENHALPQMINWSKGIDLPEGFVPETFFFLWNEENEKKDIVGQFRFRHHLTPELRDGAGHIGYQIKAEHRRKGFGTEGLRLTILEAKKILPKYGENELYLRCNVTNPASLACMLKNGATIHHQTSEKYFTRINLASDCTVEIDNGLLNVRVGAIIMKNGQFLMVGNNQQEYLYSVGGRVKFGETAEEAVIREVFEETGHKLEIEKLGFVHENFFYGDEDDPNRGRKLIYEISFFFYMKTPEDFEPICSSFTETGSKEKLVWVSADTEKTVYPTFFKTELSKKSDSVKHFVTDGRK